MKIRLGYVSISKSLENVTSSHSVSYTNFLKYNQDVNKIYEAIDKNLHDLEEIIDYNIKNNIHFYRLTSNLIPLATHKEVRFSYLTRFEKQFKNIARKIKEHSIRVDIHPDQFTVLNSTNKEVLENTFRILKHQYEILQALEIKDKIIILHVGSNVFGKEKSIQRFVKNFQKLPSYIKECIAIENDDKIFNIEDVLNLCKTLKVPCVLDYHHHICNGKENINIKELYHDIFSTWKINPKIHFSSPKNKTKKNFRSHHDYINVDSFIKFIEEVKTYPFDIDIMIEAKEKDEALFRLVRNLNHFIDETTFEVD